MRITRAAKVAAFPLIVLALVALVACQGGPGTKGDKGDKGDTGPSVTGGTGPRGYSPLTFVTANKDKLYLVNDGGDTTGLKVGGPTIINLAPHFSGGIGGVDARTYMAEQVVSDAQALASTYGLSEVTGGMLTVTLNKSTFDTWYVKDTAAKIKITATDNAMESRWVHIYVARNKKPELPMDVTPIMSVATFRMGHQGAKPPGTTPTWPGTTSTPAITCTMFNACVIDLIAAFVDDDHTATTPALEYSATAASDHVIVAPDAKGIKVTGVKSTAKANGTNGAAEAVKVTVMAMDSEGLSTERFFSVVVDGQPNTDTKSPVRQIDLTATAATARELTFDLNAFVNDPEMIEGLRFQLLDKAGKPGATPITMQSSPFIDATLDGSMLKLVGKSLADEMMLMIRGTETENAATTNRNDVGNSGIGQWLDITLTVTNK